jgi:L-phenylalanine/L-methionine N-acetyltransferase
MTLLIRRISPKDAAAVARHMSDPSVFGGLLQMPYASEEAWQKRLAEQAGSSSADLQLVAERGGEIVGTAGLVAPGPHARRRHVMGLGISVAPASRRQGIGNALMTALCDYADRWAGVLRLELTVYVDNAVAIRLYERFGFVAEGTFKSYALRDGAYVDALSMARLHPNPPTI